MMDTRRFVWVNTEGSIEWGLYTVLGLMHRIRENLCLSSTREVIVHRGPPGGLAEAYVVRDIAAVAMMN